MPHYDKLPPQREAAVDDIFAEARAAPSLESALLRAHENVTRRTLWIGRCPNRRGGWRHNPHNIVVLQALLSNVKPGTRTATVSWNELMRQCGIGRSCLAEALCSLDRDSNTITPRRRGQKPAAYNLSDELFDTPQPEPTVHGPLLDGPPGLIRPPNCLEVRDGGLQDSDPEVRHGGLLNPEVCDGGLQNRQRSATADFRTERINRNAVGGGGVTEQLEPPPPTEFRRSVGNLDLKEILRTLRRYDPAAHEGQAVTLASNCRKAKDDCTTAQICDKINLKGKSLQGANSKIAVLLKAVPQLFGEFSQQLDLEDELREQEESQARDRQAEEEQRRTDEREQRESQIQQAADDAFCQLPAEQQTAFREKTEREFLREHPQARTWKDLGQLLEARRRKLWRGQWEKNQFQNDS
jgi:hypothetical protein